MKQLRPYQREAVNQCWNALKLNDEPLLLMASVGAGKSLMLANILLTMARAGKRALCLVNNAELVRNNCATLIDEGGNASIYCAALGEKEDCAPIIFGTPQSILNAINRKEPISDIRFNLIVVDEAHAINFRNSTNCFMRILRHYKQAYPEMRLLGATGTDFRFKGTAIVGSDCLFKTKVGNITTEKLINDGYLVKPLFEIDNELVIDFSKVKIKKNGQFDQKQLELIIEKSARLTELICHQVIHVMESQNRFGVFFFASTKKHAFEILSHLPIGESAIILGVTPQHERTEILEKARQGNIKYLVNIAIISVGVDVPAFDTLAYLRPTESLVLLVQTMGRVLRLSPQTNKENCLVLDFAGNIERHRDWDNPILLDAVKQTIDKDKPLVIQCPACLEMNTEHARRCVAVMNGRRCDYYFEFKACPNESCLVSNDIAARYCRECETEIIDPNEKLHLDKIVHVTKEVTVIKAQYALSGTHDKFRVNCQYRCQDKNGNIDVVYEQFTPCSKKAMNVFYGQFVRKHCVKSSLWYPFLGNRLKVEEMLQSIRSPYQLQVTMDKKIKKKYFNDDEL